MSHYDCPKCGGYKPWHRDICWPCYITRNDDRREDDNR